MKEKLETREGGEKAMPRLYHDFVILLLFTTISPSRNLDMMRLRIIHEEEMRSARPNEQESNWIIFNIDGTTDMVINNFKTSRTYGCNRIRVSNYDYVDRHVRAYVQKHRRKLIGEKEHDFLFVRPSGDSFTSSEAFSTYLEKAFTQHNGGLKFTTTTLRKALVTWVIETEKDEEVRQAVARLMSHTTRVQQLRYDTLSSARKMKKAADHLTGKMKESLGLKRVALDGESYLPFRDQVVAVVAENSTYQQPVILLGKVLGFNMETKTVSLAELVSAGDPNHYQMNIGCLWEEDLDKIVHPIDVVYVEGKNIYVLRTPRREIHQFVSNSTNANFEEED